MPRGLLRLQHTGQTHFVTFSCYHRQPRLQPAPLRDLLVESLERTRCVYALRIYGYVVMPEHVHLLLSEPEHGLLATALQALKIAVARRAVFYAPAHGAFWQRRYYDHNVRDYDSFVEKLRYLHRNPVKRGLVAQPDEWRWSSFHHYWTGARGVVEIESSWTAARRGGNIPHPWRVPFS